MEIEAETARAATGRITWQCACFNTRKAARAVTKFYDDVLAPSGLKATQLTMLGAISISGPTRMSDLADMLGLDKTTLTRNLKLLQADGLIDVAAGDDRRVRVATLTTRAGALSISRSVSRFVRRNGARWLTANISSNPSVDARRPMLMMPALLMKTWIAG